MLKLYEEFVEYDKLYDIVQQLENRIKYWFGEKGSLGKDTSLGEINSTLTNKYSTRSIIVTYNNENFMYQAIFTVASDKADKCHITLKRYDLDDSNLIDKIQDDVDLDEVKEDLIIKKMSEMEGKSDNPEDSPIEVEKEPETDPVQDEQSQGGQPQGEPVGQPQDEFGGAQFDIGGPGGQSQSSQEEFEF
jgi:hypothetical protein